MKVMHRTWGVLSSLALAGCIGTFPNTHAYMPTQTQTQTATKSGIQGTILQGLVTAPAGVIAAGGGNVIAAGGGNVIAAGSGNVIAAGSGNLAPNGARHTLGLDEKPLANSEVYLADAAGNPIPGVPPVKTDAQGNYSFPNVPAGYTFVVAAKIKTAAGKDATLQTLAKASTLGATANVSAASTLVTVDLADSQGSSLTDFNPASFQTAVQATANSLQDSDLPDLSDRAAIKAKLTELSQKVAALQSALDEIQKELTDLKSSLAQVKQELAASIASGGNGGPPNCHLLFTSNDLDNDGVLTLDDFKRMLDAAAKGGAKNLPTPEDAFLGADTSKDGKVTEDELCAFLSTQGSQQQNQNGQNGQMGPNQGSGGYTDCPTNVANYDANKDGGLEMTEWQKMYDENPGLGRNSDGSRPSASDLFKQFDRNQDGKVTAYEFCGPPQQSGSPYPMQGGSPYPMQGGSPYPMQGGSPYPQPSGSMQPMACGSPMPHWFDLQSGDAGSPSQMRLQAATADGQVLDEQNVATSTLRVQLNVPEGCPITLNLLQTQADGTMAKTAYTQVQVTPGSTTDIQLQI